MNIFSGFTAFLNFSKAAADREGLYRGGMARRRREREGEEGGGREARRAVEGEAEAIPLSDEGREGDALRLGG